MINRELYFRDPTTLELLNNGVSKVSEIGQDERQIKTLRFELETFVCDGEYARGLERILKAYLDGLGREEQKAVWVSGFFGSGKSHLVKMLRYLWEDYRFSDGATARSLVTLPPEVRDLLAELSTRSKPMGGLRAAAGTLGAGSMDNVRLAFVQLVLRSAGLPEDLAHARFVLWLRAEGLETPVAKALKKNGCDLLEEVVNLNYSVHLAEALLAASPKYGTVENVQQVLQAGFPELTSPTMNQTLDFIRQVFGENNNLPCTLLVVDEVQQFIGEKIQRAMDMQEIAENCCTKLNQRLLLVGTGQSALNTTPSLQRLQARFAVRVQLSDADVESVIRKTVLLKKPEKEPVIQKCSSDNQGELARELQNTRFAATQGDEKFFVADYPLLSTRRRFWEKVLRNTDHSGTKAQLRSQLQIVFETNQFGLVSDFLSECWDQLRRQSRQNLFQGRIHLGAALSGRDTTGVQKTVSGLIKLVSPNPEIPVPDEVLEWALRIALECRRRVKEQQKRIGSAEFRNTQFSYTMGEEGIEKFVATPELFSENSIGSDPLPPGQVWVISAGGGDENPGLYQIAVSEGPGSGMKILNQPAPPPFKESVRYAEQNLYARAKELVGDRDPRQHEFSIQLRAFDSARSGAAVGVGVLLALCSSLIQKSIKGGLAVTGGLNLGGSIETIFNPIAVVETAIEKGAASILMPISSRRQLNDLPDDLAAKITIHYYLDARDALLKALAI